MSLQFETDEREDFVPFSRSQIAQSIPQRFAQQVERHPDRLAVKCESKSMTYRELDAESNKIGYAILNHTGHKTHAVLLLLEQGALLIAAILAALKAGKIYVPQDPTSAPNSVKKVLSHSRSRLILTDSATATLAAKLGDGLPVVNVDAVDDDIPAPQQKLNLGPDTPAYLFYTSGSTGDPKGVVDTHRNVLHNVMRYTNNLHIGWRDRLSLVQSCNFSGSVSNIFCALMNGASVFPFDLRCSGGAEMARWIERERLTIFHSVPVIFEQLVANGRNFESLRVVRLEGDRATPKHVDLFRRCLNDNCWLVNGLGTTETGLVRQFFISKDTGAVESTIPIGYGVEDMEILLLDDDRKSVPAGEIGEIAVKSPYLATGYWERPDLTDAAFKTDPSDEKARIYLTGDLGRMEPDGCLSYLGRKDFQVKVRGQRVDVAAIESALLELENVADAIVATQAKAGGGEQLVAYMVVNGQEAPATDVLRRKLSNRFPSYALPTRYVELEALPLDSNGKVARKLLPVPDNERPHLAQAFIAPRTPQEEELARCFAEVLHIRDIGVNDDFFDLGGDSLKAVELAAILEGRLAARVPSDLFLGALTVANLAMRLDEDVRTPNIVCLREGSAGEPLFLFHDYHGHILNYRNLAQALSSDRPIYGVQYNGEPEGYVISASLPALAKHYADRIRETQPTGPYVLGGQCFGGLLAFETAQRLHADGEQVSIVILIDTAFPGSGMRRSADYYSIRRQWQWISAMSFTEAVKYIVVRLRNVTRFAIAVAWYFVLRLTGKRTGLKDAAIPRFLKRPTDVHRIAEANYTAQGHDGQMVLIRSRLRQNHPEWQRIADGQLKIVTLPEAPEDLPDIQLTDAFHLDELVRAIDRLLAKSPSES